MFLFFCETHKTKWQTESHRVKEDLAFHLMVQLHHRRLKFLPVYTKDKSGLHQFGNKMLPGIGSLRSEGHAQRQTLHKRVASSDAGGVPSALGEASDDPFQCAKSDSLQEEGGVADFSEADRDAKAARRDFWSMTCGYIYRHHVMPSADRVVDPIPFRKTIDVVRETETNLDSLDESIDDASWIVDDLSQSWSGSTRLRILNQRQPQGYSWVDGRVTKTQVQKFSRPCRNVTESKAATGYEKRKQNTGCASEKNTHDGPPGGFGEVDAIIENARKEEVENTMEAAMPCVSTHTHPTAKAPMQKVASVKRRRWETPWSRLLG